MFRLILFVSFVSISCVDPSLAGDSPGTIEGTVTYRRDAKRRWRYARYYIKDSKKGHLAEAVVALRSSKLRVYKDKSRPLPATVDQKNFRFIPETVAIRVGATVTFKNSDRQVHNVRSSTGIHPFNVNMPPRSNHQEAFEMAGGIRQPAVLGCTFHSSMRGWVFVFRHPFFQVTGANGRYRFTKVPAGTYTVEMRHPAGGLAFRKKVKVVGGQATKLDIVVSPDNKLAKP